MKKIIAVLLTIALALGLSACGEYEPDTTGYEAARDHQEYLDNPSEYEGDLVYVKGTVVDLEYSGIICINDSNEKKWVATYFSNDYSKIKLKAGKEVVLFGYLLQPVTDKELVGLMLIKVDQGGKITYTYDFNGKKLEDIYVK